MTITIDEAIEALELENKHPWNRDNSILRNAVKLGIEALKRCKEARKKAYFTTRSLLPGETKQ